MCRHVPDGNGGCLDLLFDLGPAVGVFPCLKLPYVGQRWRYSPVDGHLVSVGNSERCLTSHGASAGQFMVDEFGDGELTFFGPYVTDYCVTAC